MKNPFVLKHGYGCISKLAFIILFLFAIGSMAFGQEKDQTVQERSDALKNKIKTEFQKIDADTVGLESKLIKKYEAEVEKLKKAFDQVYMQVAVNDPIVTNRMNQLLDANPQAVSIMTALQLYTKLIADLKGVSYGGTKSETVEKK